MVISEVRDLDSGIGWINCYGKDLRMSLLFKIVVVNVKASMRD